MNSKNKVIYKQSASLNKRKRGILRKAMELSKLCGQQVHITIGDPSSKTLAEYKSDKNFNGYENFEIFDDGDYEDLSNRYLNNQNFEKIQNKHRHYLELKKMACQNSNPAKKLEIDQISSLQSVKFSIKKHTKSKKIQKSDCVVPQRSNPVPSNFDFDRDFELCLRKSESVNEN